MKIQKLIVKNFKAVTAQEAEFKGCSAIITAGNERGKTSFLRGLIDRFRGEKPEIILKTGEEKGLQVMELTDGSRIEWNFTEKSETFKFITSEGFEMKSGVLKAIGEKYFGIKFDIDKFLNSPPKSQVKELQKLVGLDFDKIEQEYKEAYDERTAANNELKRLRSNPVSAPEQIEKPDVEALTKALSKVKQENNSLYEKWLLKNNEHKQNIMQHNLKVADVKHAYEKLNEVKDSALSQFIDFKGCNDFLDEIGEKKELTSLPEPVYQDEDKLQTELNLSYEKLRAYDRYEDELKRYRAWLNEGKEAAEYAKFCDEKVKSIEKSKRDMIANANIPQEFEITDTGITYKGYPLDDNQISSSGKYIAALKLGAMVLGEVRALHFDASFLDNNSLKDVQKWAQENDLQLLIERPDMQGGDIQYEII